MVSRPSCSTRSRRPPTGSRGCACTRCTPCATGPYLAGAFGDHLRHVSYFLSPVTRPHFAAGTIDLVPNNFSEMRRILRDATNDPLVLASASLPDRHGYFSLGLNADYVSSFIGRARFFLEANPAMPRTFGRNQVHVSQIVGWTRADYPLLEVHPPAPTEADERIAAYIAERIPDGATLQTGIGAIPNAVMASLRDHRDLGVHTELLSDGVVDLVERGVVNGVLKQLNRTKTVGTFALGTRALYDFLDENAAFELWPVRYVNDPRVIAQERNFVSINATLAVDFVGQAASETLGGAYYSSSGGQADFARGAMYSDGGQGFIVLRSVGHGGVSRIVPRLAAGRRGDDVEEHGRQGGHRVGRGRAAWPLDPPAHGLAHRHRPPGPPRAVAGGGEDPRLRLRARCARRG